MNELQLFKNEEFGEIRTIEKDGAVWFVAKDVATALGYKNSRDALYKHVDKDDKGVAKCDTRGGSQDLIIINESGVYSLAFASKLPTAKKFKHWVSSEVLPQIRKTGNYLSKQEMFDTLTSPDFIIGLATELKNSQEQVRQLEAKIEEDKPKTIFADAVTASESSIRVRDLAKLIKQNGVDIGEKRLYKWLRENGYICKFDTTPTQKAMQQGLFEVSIHTIQRADGNPLETRTTKVTGKGQQYFVNKFLS